MTGGSLPCSIGCLCGKHNGKEFDLSNYQTQHDRVEAALGPASNQDCVDCGNVADDWSHRHGTDRRDPHNYDPRCPSCHSKYDISGERNGRARLTAKEVLEIRELHSKPGFVRNEVAARYGVSPVTIRDIIFRYSWRHI